MPFLGMRGTGDWANNQRPENWRETILYLYPNGDAPLTAIMSMMGSEPTDDPRFHWWTKNLPTQRAAVTGIYTDVALSSAKTGNFAEDETIYVKGAEADIKQFRVGHQVLLRDADDYTVDTAFAVTARNLNGASSYVAVKALEANSNTIDGVDSMLVIGNRNPEGGTRPNALSYDPVEYENVTQIFRTPLEITRTARKTRLRTGDAYAELKREALELHSIEMEKAILWSVLTSKTGDNGKPLRTMDGLHSFINTYASDNVNDFTVDQSGNTWLAKGEEWFDEKLELAFRYGSQEKLGICGSGALLGLQRLAKSGGQVNLEPMTMDYGIQVIRWITPFGTLYLKRHPLFSYETTNRNEILILEPSNLKQRFIDDTMFIPDQNDNNGTDGTNEEYLTEMGLEYHHPTTFDILHNVGVDG